ncbi:MAG TPA: RodZ domain-containing protein [Noviherbaspirillum sp.]
MNEADMNNATPEEGRPQGAPMVEPSAPPAPATPGAALAAARESHGWSVDQVAAYLKLAPRQVHALESDDYSALPGMAIVRGFVRSYAKLLKLDPAPLLVQLGGETVLANESLKPKESLSAPFSEARIPSMAEKPTISSKWMIAVLLVVLLVAAFWASRQHGQALQSAALPSSQSDQGAGVAEAPANEQVAQPEHNEQEAAAVSPPANSTSEQGADPAVSEQPLQSQSMQPSVPGATEASASAAPAPLSGAEGDANALSLLVREESWIEIRSAGGRTILARLAQPGENISVAVNEPIELVVGNAAGVDARLRGEPFALKGRSSSNVVRVSVK